MKAISLWQPYASLIAWGAKTYETRGWFTAYRGPLVICAAKTTETLGEIVEAFKGLRPGVAFKDFPPGNFYREFIDVAKQQPMFQDGVVLGKLPLGAALCVVELTAIYRTSELRDRLDERELAFGGYSDGRYAWKLTNVRVFDEPIPVRGKQGLFDWEGELPMLEAEGK